jgi:predicted nucleic acid-binding protein
VILLDSDIVIDLLRNLPQAIGWFASMGHEVFVLPGYTAMELVQGCRSRAELRRVDQQIESMMIAWPDPETCDRALATYARLRFSRGLGLLDSLVGQLAVSLDLPLHTFNQKHYSGIDGLTTVQPYAR